MDSQGVIRWVIETRESEDSRTTAELAQAVRSTLDAHDAAPYRPTCRFMYDTTATDSPPGPPAESRPSPPASPPPCSHEGLPFNPRILVRNDSSGRPAPWGHVPEAESTVVIEDVTIQLTDANALTPDMLYSFLSDPGFEHPPIHPEPEGAPSVTGESVFDDVGLIHESVDPTYGSSSDRT